MSCLGQQRECNSNTILYLAAWIKRATPCLQHGECLIIRYIIGSIMQNEVIDQLHQINFESNAQNLEDRSPRSMGNIAFSVTLKVWPKPSHQPLVSLPDTNLSILPYLPSALILSSQILISLTNSHRNYKVEQCREKTKSRKNDLELNIQCNFNSLAKYIVQKVVRRQTTFKRFRTIYGVLQISFIIYV